MGAEEMICISQLLNDARNRTPKTIDTMTFRNRVKNIVYEIAEVVSKEGIKLPRSYSHGAK